MLSTSNREIPEGKEEERGGDVQASTVCLYNTCRCSQIDTCGGVISHYVLTYYPFVTSYETTSLYGMKFNLPVSMLNKRSALASSLPPSLLVVEEPARPV